jgi:UDP-N-acetylmuramate dehydrogenase
MSADRHTRGGPPPHIARRGELREREPMARHVSWRAGGMVDRAYFPADLEDLRGFLQGLPSDEPVYFVGLGSNLLVRDGGLRGTVIFTHWALKALGMERTGEDRGGILAEAGVASPKLARYAAVHGYAGAEFLASIPGTVGGALAMNAGCYGGETWAGGPPPTTVDRSGALHERSPPDYEISYRTVRRRESGDAGNAEEWFVSAVFGFSHGDTADSRQRIKEFLSRRIQSQPLSMPNAGSVFRNPPGAYAARLIEDCGLKGKAIGGAAISEKHANFIVNTGNARAADIEALIELAQATVRRVSGVELEREVRIVGDKP